MANGIIFTTFLIILFSFLPKSSEAFTTKSTPSKDQIFQDTPSIIIEVDDDKNTFDPNVGYTFSAWNLARGENYCGISQYSKNKGPATFTVTSNKITVSWTLQECRNEIGQYKFQLWSGQGTIDRNGRSLIADYSFSIQQVGGGVPTLTPLEDPVLVGTDPTVLLSNARIGNSYAFWWDPSQLALAESKKNVSAADLKNGILFVKLKRTDGEFKAGVTRKLCMEIGNYDWAANLTCRFSTTFTFVNKLPPPKGIQCSILPSFTPSISDDISLKISNAVPGTSYGGWLDREGEVFAPVQALSVDATKTLVLPIGQKLPTGNYVTQIYDTSTAKTLDECKLGFSVGDVDTSGNKNICNIKPENCSKSAGKFLAGCTNDQTNPGISTAIGCIHTNPADLTKDLLKFGLSIGGGLSFLMMLFGAFQMMTSAGNPETLNAGRQRLTSAIIGLLFVILSILFLQIIGWNILQLPGFGTK